MSKINLKKKHKPESQERLIVRDNGISTYTCPEDKKAIVLITINRSNRREFTASNGDTIHSSRYVFNEFLNSGETIRVELTRENFNEPVPGGNAFPVNGIRTRHKLLKNNIVLHELVVTNHYQNATYYDFMEVTINPNIFPL